MKWIVLMLLLMPSYAMANNCDVFRPLPPINCGSKEPICMCFGNDNKCTWVWVCER